MRSRSIQLSIIIGFSALLVATIIIISVFTFYLFNETLIKNSLNNNAQVVAQLNRDIDNYVSNMDNISIVVEKNNDLQNYINTEPLDNQENTPDLKNKVTSFFQSIISVRKDIDSIILLLDDHTIVSDQPDDKVNQFAEWPSLSTSGKTIGLNNASLSSSYVQDIIMGKYPWVITLSRDVYDVKTNAHRGILLVDLDYRIIEGLCSNIQLGESGYVFIIKPGGEIVYHPRQQLIYSGLKSELVDRVKTVTNGQVTDKVDGRDVLYTTNTSDYTGWTVVGVSYIDEIFYNRASLQYYFAMIAVACFFASVIISFYISVRITQPIEVLRRSMQAVEAGNFDINISVNSTDEVNALAQDFNITIRKIKELIQQNNKTSEQKRKHELKALQAQINPHFLYNTLDSIVWMIECGEYENAITMTSSLARFFRLGISKGADIITVQDEIEHLNLYLTIQKLRYKDRIDFQILVDPEIYQYKTLKMLIQPLVENAIYHGLKMQDKIGMLTVQGKKDGNDIVFKVIDNGAGMTQEELSNLLNGHSSSKGLGGVGVKNVSERIHLYFGDSYNINYESEKGVGTVVTIRLPALIESNI